MHALKKRTLSASLSSLLVTLMACGGGSTTPPANQSPTANAGADQAVNELAQVTLTGSGTDTDGNIASYSWTQVSGPTVDLSSTSSASTSFSVPPVNSNQNLVFQLSVTDNQGATATDTVTISVNDTFSHVLTIHSNTKRCQELAAFSNGEIIIHNANGSIAQRQALHASGINYVGLQTELVNFSLLTHEVDAMQTNQAIAKTFYAVEANAEYWITNDDYSNLPQDCSCENAKVDFTTALPDGPIEAGITAADHYYSSINFASSEQILRSFCASSSKDIYAFLYQPNSNGLSWGVDSYQIGANDTAFVDPRTNLHNASIAINGVPNDHYAVFYQNDSESRLSFSYTPSITSSVPVITNLSVLDQQLFDISTPLPGSDSELRISRSLNHLLYRESSEQDLDFTPIENPGDASFNFNLEQSTYSVTPEQLTINAVESYLYLSTSDGYAMIYAPLTNNGLSISLPQYPAEFGLDLNDETLRRTSRVRQYHDQRSYQQAISSRYGEHFTGASYIVVTERKY